MVSVNGVEFATSLGVLFKLKEINGCKTLQETYKLLETNEMDSLLSILRVSYNIQNKTTLDLDAFLELMSDKKVGFLLLAEVFQKVVEALMFDGLTPEQVEERKKALRQVAKS